MRQNPQDIQHCPHCATQERSATAIIDEINTLNACFAAVSDLMIPGSDLHTVNRDNLATLLGYLSGRLQAVTEGAV